LPAPPPQQSRLEKLLGLKPGILASLPSYVLTAYIQELVTIVSRRDANSLVALVSLVMGMLTGLMIMSALSKGDNKPGTVTFLFVAFISPILGNLLLFPILLFTKFTATIFGWFLGDDKHVIPFFSGSITFVAFAGKTLYEERLHKLSHWLNSVVQSKSSNWLN
jgi:hypothetical protein